MSQHQDGPTGIQQGVRGDVHVQPAAFPDGQDVDPKLFANVQLEDGHAQPALRDGQLVDGVAVVQLSVIQNVVGGQRIAVQAASCFSG